jgi:hypothetical protein
MWPSDDKTQAFQALSYREKLRVSRCLSRGEAPTDPRLAAAAVELAESYGRQSRATAIAWRFALIFLVVGAGCLMISGIEQGDPLTWTINSLVALTNIGYLALNPSNRPKNMARGLEASERIAAAGL